MIEVYDAGTKKSWCMIHLRVYHRTIAIGGVIASHKRHQPMMFATMHRIQALKIDSSQGVMMRSREYADLLSRPVPCKMLTVVMQEAVLR